MLIKSFNGQNCFETEEKVNKWLNKQENINVINAVHRYNEGEGYNIIIQYQAQKSLKKFFIKVFCSEIVVNTENTVNQWLEKNPDIEDLSMRYEIEHNNGLNTLLMFYSKKE